MNRIQANHVALESARRDPRAINHARTIIRIGAEFADLRSSYGQYSADIAEAWRSVDADGVRPQVRAILRAIRVESELRARREK